MTWIAITSYTTKVNNVTNKQFSIFAGKDDALMFGAYSILDHIRFEWDWSQLDIAIETELINNLVIQGDYRGAIDFFNACYSNTSHSSILHLYIKDTKFTIPNIPITIDPLSLAHITKNAVSNGPNQPVNQVPYSPIYNTTVTTNYNKPINAYIPVSKGATCRGPCCIFNEYGVADKPDDTYVCYSCKTFYKIS